MDDFDDFFESDAYKKFKETQQVVISVFSEQYYAEEKPLRKNGKLKPFLIKDKQGNKYRYRIMTSSYGIYQKLKDANIDGIPRVYELRKVNREVHVREQNIDGITLQDYKNLHPDISDDKAYSFMLQISDILKRLHSLDIAHNDIKLTNIMVDNHILCEDGHEKIWLIDYDVSKIVDRTKHPEKDMDTTQSLTPGYATLEQMNGCVIDATDICLLGMTIKKLLGGDSYDGYLKQVIAKSCEYDYKLRYPTAEELYVAIRNAKKEYDIFECDKVAVPKINPKDYTISRQTFSIGFFKKNELTIWSGGLKWNNENIEIDNIRDICCPGIRKSGINILSATSVKISFFDGREDIEFRTTDQELKKMLWYAIGPSMMKATINRYIQQKKHDMFKYKKPKVTTDRDLLFSNGLSIMFDEIFVNKIWYPYPYKTFQSAYVMKDFDMFQLPTMDTCFVYMDDLLAQFNVFRNYTDFNSFKDCIALIILKAIMDYKAKNMAALADSVNDIMYMFNRKYF